MLMATAKQTMVLIAGATRVPLPVPDDFRALVAAFEQ
jgi:acyl-CoA thioesterase FadM